MEYYLWVGIFAPKATPANIITTLSGVIDKAGNSDLFKTAITNAGLEPDLSQRRRFHQILGGRRQAFGRGGEIDRPRPGLIGYAFKTKPE